MSKLGSFTRVGIQTDDLPWKKQICWLKLACGLDECVSHRAIQSSWRRPVNSVSTAAVWPTMYARVSFRGRVQGRTAFASLRGGVCIGPFKIPLTHFSFFHLEVYKSHPRTFQMKCVHRKKNLYFVKTQHILPNLTNTLAIQLALNEL